MRTYQTADLGDRVVAYLDEGAGAPLVFIHAFPLNATMWAPQLDRLPPGWRALAPDLRGFQYSRHGGASPARHVSDYASDLLRLVAEVAAGPAVLVGLSMGGYVAFECWRQRPDLVRALVLADTRAEADSDEARAKRRDMQALVRREGPPALAEAMLPTLLGAATQTAEPHRVVEVRKMIVGNTADAIVDALEALRTRPDSRETLPEITCPTLVVVGAEDTLTPPAMAEALAAGLSDVQQVTIPLAGHLSNIEQPDAFNAALFGWLERRFGTGADAREHKA